MKLRLTICLFLLGAVHAAACGPDGSTQQEECSYSRRMFVKRMGGDLYVSAKMDAATDITYWFKRCMFNELYTFCRVGMTGSREAKPTTSPEAIPEVILNTAYSDNIGPFAVAGHGWCGGNHKYLEQSARTACNESYAIIVDGRRLEGDCEVWASSVVIEVENVILDPSRPYLNADGHDELRDTLCRESVTYRIYRNNIEVAASHHFCNREPATIAIYYGMQSMFEGETHTFTAGGAYNGWTEQAEVSSFTKGEYPRFRRFIEKNPTAYQSAFLLPDGLGSHGELADGNVVFIGNSHGKSYHKLVADMQVDDGDKTCWRGVYTWFASPIADDAELLCYEGVVDGSSAIFIDCTQACERTLRLPSHLGTRHYEITGQHGDMRVSACGNGHLNISANDAGGCILRLK